MNYVFNAAVLGSTGYVGLELIKILLRHPNIKINFLGCENSPNKQISDFSSNINDGKLPTLDLNDNFNPINSDVVFLALPHGVSHKYVKKYFNKIKIIDLSADFRLDSSDIYNSNYNKHHSCLELLNKFTYGLPEIYKDNIIEKNNIAIPGCYPTSILLPIIPLLKKNLLKVDNIIIDSKSGYSGAGKRFDIMNIKNQQNLNFYNYNTNNHRHICEIKQELFKHTNQKIEFSFNPHILPVFRGMMSTIYCDLKKGIIPADINNTLIKFSKKLPFVHFLNNQKKGDFFLIQNTNHCFIKLFKHHSDTKIIIVSLIDNLIKGAAGQAVQCFNISTKLDEKLSLIS